jgi:hypothetical protein
MWECESLLPLSGAVAVLDPALCSVCSWTFLSRVLAKLSPAALTGLE